MFNYKVNSERAIIARLSFIAAAVVLVFAGAAYSQTAPSSTPEQTYGGYRVAATTEFGWRWRSLDGNENKYRSDLNYKDRKSVV